MAATAGQTASLAQLWQYMVLGMTVKGVTVLNSAGPLAMAPDTIVDGCAVISWPWTVESVEGSVIRRNAPTDRAFGFYRVTFTVEWASARAMKTQANPSTTVPPDVSTALNHSDSVRAAVLDGIYARAQRVEFVDEEITSVGRYIVGVQTYVVPMMQLDM